MTDSITPISASAFHATDGLEDWRVLGDGAYAHFRTGSLTDAARLVQAIGDIPGTDGHPPADRRPGGRGDRQAHHRCRRLLRHERAGRRAGASDLGAARESWASRPILRRVQNLLVVPGAPAGAEIVPFWRAILGYEPRPDSPDEDLVDPHDRGPAFWFEAMDEPRPDGGGAIHVAVWVPIEEAEARVQAALAAGGRMVRDDFAPSWWTLADAAGNEADVATVAGRD